MAEIPSLAFFCLCETVLKGILKRLSGREEKNPFSHLLQSQTTNKAAKRYNNSRITPSKTSQDVRFLTKKQKHFILYNDLFIVILLDKRSSEMVGPLNANVNTKAIHLDAQNKKDLNVQFDQTLKKLVQFVAFILKIKSF